MRRLLLGAVAMLALAACQPPDPLTEARRTCQDGRAEAEARIESCSTLIDTGGEALDEAARADALANRGQASDEAGDVSAALSDFNAALQLAPDNAQAKRGKAGILIASGQLDAAQPLVHELIQSGEYLADAHYYSGRIAQAGGNIEDALAAYDRALRENPRYAEVYAQRGAIKQAREDYAEAITDYDEAININPQLAPALAGRCWSRVLIENGDAGAARRDGDRAAEVDPRNVQGQLCRGLLQLREGEWANAQVSYEAALEVEPGNPMALFGRGVARRRGGDNEGTRDMNQARDFSSNIDDMFIDLGVRTY